MKTCSYPNRKKAERLLYIVTASIIWTMVITCLFLDAMVGAGNVSSYVNTPSPVELGYLVERKLIEDNIRIKKMMEEVDRIRAEDARLLKGVLEENGIFIKEGEGCDYNFKERRFKFYEIKGEVK